LTNQAPLSDRRQFAVRLVRATAWLSLLKTATSVLGGAMGLIAIIDYA